MSLLENYRNMELICRQRASSFPAEKWKHLAEAEMWQHKALDLHEQPDAYEIRDDAIAQIHGTQDG